jgi:hypothetical protein
LGAKDTNTALAVVHEAGFAKISSGNLSLDAVKTMREDAEQTVPESSGYDECTMSVRTQDGELDPDGRMFG